MNPTDLRADLDRIYRFGHRCPPPTANVWIYATDIEAYADLTRRIAADRTLAWPRKLDAGVVTCPILDAAWDALVNALGEGTVDRMRAIKRTQAANQERAYQRFRALLASLAPSAAADLARNAMMMGAPQPGSFVAIDTLASAHPAVALPPAYAALSRLRHVVTTVWFLPAAVGVAACPMSRRRFGSCRRRWGWR